jgi:hypothetical protein
MTNTELGTRIYHVRFLLKKYKVTLHKVTNPRHTILSTKGVTLLAEEIQAREVELHELLELQKQRKNNVQKRNGKFSNRNLR